MRVNLENASIIVDIMLKASESYAIKHGDKILFHDLIFVDTMFKKSHSWFPRIDTVAKGIIMKDSSFYNGGLTQPGYLDTVVTQHASPIKITTT